MGRDSSLSYESQIASFKAETSILNNSDQVQIIFPTAPLFSCRRTAF